GARHSRCVARFAAAGAGDLGPCRQVARRTKQEYENLTLLRVNSATSNCEAAASGHRSAEPKPDLRRAPPRRVHLCRGTSRVTTSNHQIQSKYGKTAKAFYLKLYLNRVLFVKAQQSEFNP